MKKILGVIGALTIGIFACMPVVACFSKESQQDDKKGIKKPKETTYNNSLNNLQGTAALMAKKIILADQYEYSSKVLNTMFSNTNAKEAINKLNANDNFYDENDFALDGKSTFGDLSFRYFGNDNGFNNTKFSSNINLNGKKGTSNELVRRFIPDQGFSRISSEAIAEAIELIIKLIPSISTSMVTNILSGFGSTIDFSILENKIGHQNIKYISQTVKQIFTNKVIVEKINQRISRMDVVRESYDLSLTNITGAMFICISNGITLIKNPQFVPYVTSTDNDIKMNLPKAAESLYLNIQPLNASSKVKDFKKEITLANALNYAQAAQEFAKGLQFFQMQFSVFDKTKSTIPKNGQYLFDNELNNKKVYEKLLKGKIGNKFAATSINLKYLLTTLKYYLGAIGNQNDPEGRRLQKFIFILFGDNTEVTEKFEFDWSETGNTVRHKWNFLSKNGSSGTNFGYYLIRNYLVGENSTVAESIWRSLTSVKVPAIGAISKISLQNFKNLIKSDQFYYLICNFFYALANDEGVSDGFKGPLNQTLKKLFNKTIVGVTNFPKYLTKNLFLSLYSKDFRTEFSVNIGSIYSINIWDKFNDSTKNSVNQFLGGPDIPMNIQSVLKKELSSFLNSSDPKDLWNYYTKKTIPEIIDNLSSDFNINESHDLKKLQSYGIYISDILKLFNNYLVNNQYTDEYGVIQKGNIISQILENLPNFLRILGITSFGVKENSLWDFLSKHFFIPNHKEHEIRKGINLNIGNKLIYANDKKELIKVLNDNYSTSSKNQITLFTNRPKLATADKVTQKQINESGYIIENWNDIFDVSNKEFWVVNQFKSAGKYIIVEIEKVIVEHVSIDFLNEVEVTDHLQEIFQVLNRIYKKINIVKNYKKEVQENFENEAQYQWVFSKPHLIANKIISSQIMKVIYINSQTNAKIAYEFQYSRKQGTWPFKFDSISKKTEADLKEKWSHI
ncbi:MOLPALP family lipoprotein [Mesoplasma syrphidae]|uniref:MOLPALP family lipoprotein n=1 Tax=Mesoplasma syrphidae TaxID=225999 RepID=A0A2K9BQQ6_9MOLU|nr:MOLPALP family lipoprotein [Mesoplasma syrphidae]AUF83342.1 MOLPALP family lipoprotein [Mesoplasma syrphidae]